MEIHKIRNRREVVGILFILGIFSVVVLITQGVQSGNFYGNLQFCQEFDVIIEQESLELADISYDITDALTFNEKTVPYVIQNRTYYISQDMENPYWEGELGVAEGYKVYVMKDAMWDLKRTAIESGHLFQILVIKGKQCQVANMVVSGLPILALTETYGLENPQRICLLDKEKNQSYEGYCVFGMRGQTSATLPKYGYKIELCDETWNEEKVSLLGLRKDDDWILNPLYGDYHKVREKMAYQIWQEMQTYHHTTENSSNITYVELILNNQYWGIYGLQEPVDDKQVSFDEIDIMYRKTDMLVPTESEFDVTDKTKVISGFEIREPNEEDIVAEDWLPMKEYVRHVYDENMVADIDVLSNLMDIDNAVDYELFLQVVAAWDNIYKNINYLARYENGSYKMYQVPWDLNYTFGHDFAGNATYTEYDLSQEDCEIVTREYSALLRADAEWAKEEASNRWFEYRQSIFSEEHLKEIAQSYMDELTGSGALTRDTVRWPESGNTSDLAELYQFIENRLAYLDEYYARNE